MANTSDKDQADWQKNSGRPSNFNEKDESLYKGENGNLRVKKEKNGLSDEEDKTIQDTLDSLEGNEEE
ncbi:hypothetical protein [uncultured Christiangramia sp.]|uniref:hypothetical protein n=1 Tax=Christiangramia sp. 3-2217-3z TaxID=3417564 RepID=UPI0025D86771|nr:hypothetical protein [uncultured Christiangramia sp.]|tara:strand:- start:637 stop:840 length:204 start_codon:yes stop_codon:yes gene_type:complete